MNVLVDTNIWSLALRKRRQRVVAPEVHELQNLIEEGRAQLIGPIRQEVLSGISDLAVYEKLKEILSAFSELALSRRHYELAASMFNRCRKHRIQTSYIDFLICATAQDYGIPVFSLDKDFLSFARHLKIALYRPRKRVFS